MSALIVPRTKPRNPLARLARQRRAGSHAPSRASQRQAARRELRGELSRLAPRRSDRSHPPSD